MVLTLGRNRRRNELCQKVCLAGSLLLAAAAAHAQAPGRPGLDKAASTSRAAASPEQKLDRAKLAYQRGDYGAVVLLLRPLLYPQTLLAQEEQVLLSHKLLALSYYFEHDEAGAEQEFNLLVSLKPDFALDPVVDPLQAVAFLDDIRRRNAERLQEIRRRQVEEEQRRRLEAEQLQKQAEALAQKRTRRIYIERVVHRRFSAIDLLPFGIPQLVARRRALGGTLLAAQAITGAASLGTWLTVRYRYPSGQFPPRELLTTQALTGTYLGTGVVFWGLVLTGLIDSLLHARTVVELRELSGPPPELAPQGSSPPRAAVRLDSEPSGGLQLSVGGTF